MAQTLTNVKAKYSFSGKQSNPGNQASGATTIGDVTDQTNSFATADILYALRITSTGATDDATLTLTSGTVVRNVGTPDVTRWGTATSDLTGEDAFGVALATMVTFYYVRAITKDGNTGTVTLAFSNAALPDTVMQENGVLQTAYNDGVATPGTLTVTFSQSGDYVDLLVCGKSS